MNTYTFGAVSMALGILIGATAVGLLWTAAVRRRDRRYDARVEAVFIAGRPTPQLEAAEEPRSAVAVPPAVAATVARRGLRGLLDRPWGETAAARALRLGRKSDPTAETAALLVADAVTGEQVLVPGKDVDLVPKDANQLPIVPKTPQRAPDVHPVTGKPIPAWAVFNTATWRALNVSGRPDPGPQYVEQVLGRHARLDDSAEVTA